MSTVTVFCKMPRPGEVKTRLVPPLTFEEAARLARAFLQDLVASLGSIPHCRVEIALPPGAPPEGLSGLFDPDPPRVEQGRGSLGGRLARVTARVLARGDGPAAVVGSDHPNLPLEFFVEMFEEADQGRVAWVRTDDGGFAAMATPRPVPELFANVPWSTERVADSVRDNARRAGIELVDLGTWYDVDTVADLRRLARDLESTDGCAATRRELADLRPPLAAR